MGRGRAPGALTDPRFGELSIWTDADSDRATDPGELGAASEGSRRLVSIDLAFNVAPSCDARGNCAVERATFVWADGSGEQHRGEVVDVHLPLRGR